MTLQLAYTDRILGAIVRRLRNWGIYDSAMVAVVADHGAAFIPGQIAPAARRRERRLDPAGADVRQAAAASAAGRIVTRPVRTIDLLPTIADVLGIRIPWRGGRPLAVRSAVPGGPRTPTSGTGRRWRACPAAADTARASAPPSRSATGSSAAATSTRSGASRRRLGEQLRGARPVEVSVESPGGTTVDPKVRDLPLARLRQHPGAAREPTGQPLIAKLNGRIVAVGADGRWRRRVHGHDPPRGLPAREKQFAALRALSPVPRLRPGYAGPVASQGRKALDGSAAPEHGLSWLARGRRAGDDRRAPGHSDRRRRAAGPIAIGVAQPIFDGSERSTYAFPAVKVGGWDLVRLAVLLLLLVPPAADVGGRAAGRAGHRGSMRGLVHLAWIGLLGRPARLADRRQRRRAERLPATADSGRGADRSGSIYLRFDAARQPLADPRLRRARSSPGCSCSPRRSSTSPSPQSTDDPKATGRIEDPRGAASIFDEFPLDGAARLQEQDRRAGAFPNFAALSRHSDWFRNAMTVADTTEQAVPAILSGDFPKPNGVAIYTDHPRNLFTLLGSSSYRPTSRSPDRPLPAGYLLQLVLRAQSPGPDSR